MLTERDEDILQTLCLKVRLLSLAQLATTWWAGNRTAEEDARRRMAKLIDSGLLQRHRVTAAPLPAMSEPVGTWRPQEPTPDIGAWAWRLQSRWQNPPRATNVYVASKGAARVYGGRARGALKQRFQATHDLGVSELYLTLRTRDPAAAALWIGEDRLLPHRKKQKLPDAVLARHPGARPQLVLEFGGSYDKRRVHEFHEECHKRNLPYELW